jgi:hypothetical protein
MKKHFIEKLKPLRNLFLSRRYLVVLGKKGYGRSYSWKDRCLFFERNFERNK